MQIKTLYTLHGLLQASAFLLLFPIGILIALSKAYIGNRWFILHIIFQTLGICCVFTAIALMAYAQYLKTKAQNAKPAETKKPLPTHVIVGIIIVILIILQVIWAVFLRHTINREIWVNIHILLAILILTLGWTNLYLGYALYNT